MVKVKICGITREEEINYVNEFLPEYIGFVFAESRRRVSIEKAGLLTEGLDKKIKKVGVFVNEETGKVVETAKICCLDVVQLHGDETTGYVEDLKSILKKYNLEKVQIWKAIRVKDKDSLNELSNFKIDAFVLDAFVEGSYGGAGKVFDWDMALKAKIHGKIILAGGLNRENVEDAVRYVKPFAVDVSSGVEAGHGKDKDMVREFIIRAKAVYS